MIPKSAQDVRQTLIFARDNGLKVVPRGHGCSSFGHCLTDSIALDMREMNAVLQITAESVTVQAGCCWQDLQTALVARGVTSPVIVNDGAATVGGTLAFGGFGTTSVHRGLQVDQVLALEIVTCEGDRIQVGSDGDDDDLFNFFLCGHGQLGILISATLRVEPYLPIVHAQTEWLFRDVDLEELAGRVLSRRPRWDHCVLKYYLKNHQWKLFLGTNHAENSPEPADQLEVIRDLHRVRFTQENDFVTRTIVRQVQRGLISREEESCRVWADFLLPVGRADAFWRQARMLFSDDRTLYGLYCMFLDEEAVSRSSLPLRPVPAGGPVMTFGAYSFVPRWELSGVQHRYVRAASLCHSLGGKMYLYGFHPRMGAFYRSQYGAETCAKWAHIKQKMDPTHRIGSPFPWAGLLCTDSSS